MAALAVVPSSVFVSAQDDSAEQMGTVIGIDLGTTYSCVGVFKNGRVEIIANDQGNRITPSYVAFMDNGDRLVGDAAKNQATINPANTVFDVKRLIGRNFSDKSVQSDKKLVPYDIVSDKNKPMVQVTQGGKTSKYAPEEVSAMILQKMKATAETLRDGWLHTGDIGRLDEDGFLTLTDRAKDLIISGGTNIYPREVEEVVARHPGVLEVSVVGQPSAEWGEDVVAFVVPRGEGACDAKVLDAWCRAEMASFKKPKRYVFCAELPKNSYGKVLKTELRKRLG